MTTIRSGRTQPSAQLAGTPQDEAVSSEAHGRASLSGEAQAGALIIGGDHQGLGIARSLGRRGIPVVVMDDERSVGRHSRYVSEFFKWPDLRTEEGTVAGLLNVAERHAVDGWVVFPTREETVAALARHRDLLMEHFRIPTPAWEVTSQAWDKRNTYRAAAEAGVPVPRSWTVRTEADLDLIDGQPPFAVKPAIKEHFLYATGCKAWRADNRAELADRFAAASAVVGAEEVIVQELIPGGGDAQLSYCAFFKDGEAVASMTANRARQHPMEFGRASTFVRTTDNPELAAVSERFLRSIGYYGLVELEYKYDAREGVAKLLDMNARTWGYHSLGQLAGVDFPYLLYADQVGLEVPRGLRAPAGLTWVRLSTDLPTAAVELFGGRLDVRAYLRSLRSVDIEGVFSRDDPRPWFAELALLPYLARRRGF